MNPSYKSQNLVELNNIIFSNAYRDGKVTHTKEAK